jgi:O-antigen ligase
MYTLSRGGYAAFLVGYLFVAVVRERKLLIVLVLILSFWSAAAPNAVKERISTIDGSGHQELDHSAQTRVALWNDALGVVKTNPLLGTGFNTYMYMGRIGAYEDTHNIYVSVLVQTGFLGLGLFLLLLWNLGRLGWQAYQRADDPFVRALGLGLAGWIICTSVANVFGDRWTYLQVNGYLWVLAACAWRGITERQAHPVAEMTPNAVDRRQMLLAPQAAV